MSMFTGQLVKTRSIKDNDVSVRPILDAVQKQGGLKILRHGSVGFAGLFFRRRKYSRAEATLLMISYQS